MHERMMYKVCFVVLSYTCTDQCVCLQEVLLHPHHLLLLLQYSVFDDPDEVVRPRPGLGLQAGVEAGNAL